MGDFDYGYERGWWGTDGIPNWIDKEQEDFSGSKENYKSDNKLLISIKINLTPTKYLDLEGRYLRTKLINNEFKNSEIDLEVIHDKYNNADSLALEVFCNKVKIGYIQKYDSDNDINEFCFINEHKIDLLTLKYINNKFELSKSKYVSKKEPIPIEKEISHRKKQVCSPMEQRLESLYENSELNENTILKVIVYVISAPIQIIGFILNIFFNAELETGEEKNRREILKLKEQMGKNWFSYEEWKMRKKK